MDPDECKQAEIERVELLYNESVLSHAREEYGRASGIKRAVKTSAKTYEIRTALRFWEGNPPSYRTCDPLWRRLTLVRDEDMEPETVERL